MRLFSSVSKLLRWLAFIVLVVLGLHFIISRTKNSNRHTTHKSLIDSFVFRDKKSDKTTIQKYNIFDTNLHITEEEQIEFFDFPTQGKKSIRDNVSFPNPRSHVMTNSSHVIRMFVNQKGCTLDKKNGIVYQYLKLVIICMESMNNWTTFKCHSWAWDPANWTLTFKYAQDDTKSFVGHRVCAFPKLTDRVGKVVYPNGTEEFPGCTFSQSPCAVVEPYFDMDLHMRINWSPCCRRMMVTMLSNAHDIFEIHRIRYVMTGGAVISVGRDNGSLIPYDTDLDLIVNIRDRGKFSNQSAVDMAKMGYYYIWNKKGNYVKICQNKACDAHIDVWFYERYPGDRHMVKYFKMRFWSLRETTLFPISWQLFEGKKYRFPRRIIKYLDHEYSTGLMAGYRNWRTVLLCNHKRGRKCTFYSDKKN